MIRHLHPTDSVLLFPFWQAAGRAQAFTLSRALDSDPMPFPAIRYASVAISLRAWQTCWVKTHEGRIEAVLRASERSGPGSWEVRDLFLRSGSALPCADLLEEICVRAGRGGARRVFMRIASGSDVFEEARAAGFYLYCSETVYRSEANARRSGETSEAESLRLRARRDEDEMPLFRLYCASVPASQRIYGPATAAEWRDAEERVGPAQDDWVMEDDRGAVAAWLRTAETKSGRFVSVAAHPDARASLGALLLVGLDGAEGRPAVAVAPSADAAVATVLERAGFTPGRAFDVLVRPVAVPVTAARGAVAPVA